MKHFDIGYPVAQDSNYKTWDAYANRFWPALYLIDQDGGIVYRHFGEGDYEVWRRSSGYSALVDRTRVQRLRAERQVKAPPGGRSVHVPTAPLPCLVADTATGLLGHTRQPGPSFKPGRESEEAEHRKYA